DTTAGGDAFIGGLLATLANQDLSAQQAGNDWWHDEAMLRRAVDVACRCGAHAVTRPGAYAALPTAHELAAF
ncbi:MAG: PfkB family carbohydrate kinase, partial [Onishia taeanensis]|uniref:PfkB family carbohydrate kinase n=1 Tax=Onishia taeanensis TaxID=284577 RepID=UPI003C7C1497